MIMFKQNIFSHTL